MSSFRGYRIIAGCLAASLALMLGGALELSFAAPQPPKKPPVEEEDVAPPTKSKPPLRIEEEEPAPPSKKAARLPDLDRAAEQTRNPALRALFRDLAIPYDIVTWKDNNHSARVEPIPSYVGPTPGDEGRVNLRLYTGSWERGLLQSTSLSQLRQVEHFEDIALARVDQFLKAAPVPEQEQALSRREQLEAAEKALVAILGFHKSTRTGRKTDPGWAAVEQRLRDRLAAVRLERLQSLADARAWAGAYAIATQFAKADVGDKAREQAAEQLARLADQTFKENNFAEGHARLKALEDLFPDSAAARPLAERLRQQARTLFEKARAQGDNHREEAGRLITEAEQIWPRLEGLRDYRLKLTAAYPVLGVGVYTVPENLSPATAVTDSERQAMDLLFESLVKPREEAGVGQTYEPELAVGLPHILPAVGRRFELVHDAYWSNGARVTAADVRFTMRLLRQETSPAYSPAWARLMEEPLPGTNSYGIDLRLHQGFLDPLALMTFKILPAAAANRLPGADDAQFARNPLGSGPFMYQAPHTDEERHRTAVFVANPYYQRGGRPGQPAIREIHFFRSDDPARDFRSGRLHLWLDVPTEDTQRLRSLEEVKIQTLRNRRIYFLAVNHRLPSLQNTNLRRVLAHAIDRNKILDDVFRAYLKGEVNAPHRPLNGPFPPDSWASKPAARELFDPLLVRKLAKNVPPTTLRLKYAEDDPRAQRACEALREQLREQLRESGVPIQLELVARPPRQLHREVELDHDYELAYYHYDYPGELYGLWPLLDPDPRAVAPGGGNYLGYQNDSELESAMQAAMGHREFSKVRELMHSIHDTFDLRMPFIPLWQLDTHVAIHQDLKVVALDPMLVFSEVGQWKLEPSRK